MAIIINIIIEIIIRQLGFLQTLIIIYTNLYLLYKCLVKLSTTKEKYLVINIMAFCQLYKRKKIIKIQWINGKDNPANTITKSTPNKALKKFINSFSLYLSLYLYIQLVRINKLPKSFVRSRFCHSINRVIFSINLLNLYNLSTLI